LSTRKTRYIDGNLESEGANGVLRDMSAKKCVRMFGTVFVINLEMIFPVPSRGLEFSCEISRIPRRNKNYFENPIRRDGIAEKNHCESRYIPCGIIYRVGEFVPLLVYVTLKPNPYPNVKLENADMKFFDSQFVSKCFKME
jgi:hypothetical protein